MNKPRCPEAVSYWEGLDTCNLNDKTCLLESGDECPYYNEYLEELQKEEDEEKITG